MADKSGSGKDPNNDIVPVLLIAFVITAFFKLVGFRSDNYPSTTATQPSVERTATTNLP